MTALANRRHELFSQGVARGLTGQQAYRDAGFTATTDGTAEVGASRLLKRDEVRARVAELQERSAVRAEITAAGLTKELQDIMTKALRKDGSGHLNTARQCVMDIAKLNGLVVDKTEKADVNRVISDRPMTEEEWVAAHGGDLGAAEGAATRPH